MKFTKRRRNLLENWGRLPLEKCWTEVELALPVGFHIEALKNNDLPAGDVPAEYRGDKLCFSADTSARPGGVMAYPDVLTPPSHALRSGFFDEKFRIGVAFCSGIVYL